MIKQVIDEKIKQNQKLKEYFEKNSLDLSNESIMLLINIAINDLETIRFLYLHEIKIKLRRESINRRIKKGDWMEKENE